MSYSALIQKDNPDIFWSLDETSGNVVNPDPYIIKKNVSGSKTLTYPGTYSESISSNIISVPTPLIYGGSSCIKINNTGYYVKVPSLFKMTKADSKNESAIEFWIKVNNTSTTEQTFMTTDSGVKISLIADYIKFSIGSYSVSVHIDTVNKPLHIIAGYSEKELILIVNGIMNTKQILTSDNIFIDTWNNGGAGFNTNNFKFVKPSGITNFQIDSIALYSYIPSRITALRHYGYGVAYNPPHQFFDANNGVYYNMSMENQQTIKNYSMGQSNNTWKISDSDNVLLENDCLTIKKRNLLRTYFSNDYGSPDILSSYFTSSTYDFQDKSYLILENTDSLIPLSEGGWAFKFSKGSGNLTPSQTYFYVGSKQSNNYIEAKANTDGIIVYINGILSLTFTISSIPDYFYLGYYVRSDETIDFVYLPSTGSPQIQNTGILNGFNFNDTFIRIGSSNTWTKDNDSLFISKIDQGLSTFNLSKIVAIHKNNFDLYSTYTNIEGSSFKHYYTIVPDSTEKRFKTKSYGYARISIPLQSLINEDTIYAGATRLEIGNPQGNDNVKVYITGQKYINGILDSTFKSNEILSNRITTSGDWLNKQSITYDPTASTSELLHFDFYLYCDDLSDNPPIVDYFRLFTYPVIEDSIGKYTLCAGSKGSNPIKLYYRNNEYHIPDLIEKPFFYNGYNSGLKIGQSYATIDYNFSSPTKSASIINITKGSPTQYTLEYVPFSNNDLVIISDVNVKKTAIMSYDASNILFTLNNHGLSDGNKIQFALDYDNDGNPNITMPGYIDDEIEFYIKKIDNNSFYITEYIDSDPIASVDDETGSGISVNFLVKSGSPWELNTSQSISNATSTTVTLPINSSSFTNYDQATTGNAGTAGIMSLVSGIQTISFMLYVPSAANTNIMKVDSIQLSLASSTLLLSGVASGTNATIYTNGVVSDPVKIGCWNNIIITLDKPIVINNNKTINITLGDSQTVLPIELYIDQLSIFDKFFSPYFVANLYSLYTGKTSDLLFTTQIDNGAKIIDLGPKDSDSEEVTVLETVIEVDHILTEAKSSGGDLYSQLKNITSNTYTLTLDYDIAEKQEFITKQAKLKTESNAGQAYIYLADYKDLVAGSTTSNASYVSKIDSSEISSDFPIVNAIDYSKVKKKTQNVIIPKSTSSVDKYTFTFSNTTGISKGDKVSSSITYKKGRKKIKTAAIPEGTIVTGFSGTTVNIQFPTGHKGFEAAIPALTDITFTPTYAKVTLSKLPYTLNSGKNIVFKNVKNINNIAENDKIKGSGGRYIKNGDLILIKDTTPPKLFLVTSEVDSSVYAKNKTIEVTFVKQSIADNTVFTDDLSLVINPGENDDDVSRLFLYDTDSNSFFNYNKFKDNKVSYRQVPQYVNQE